MFRTFWEYKRFQKSKIAIMIWIHGSKFYFLPSITNGRVPLFLTFINYDPYHYSLLLFYFYAHHFQISIPCSFLALEECSNAKVFPRNRSLRLSKNKIALQKTGGLGRVSKIAAQKCLMPRFLKTGLKTRRPSRVFKTGP